MCGVYWALPCPWNNETKEIQQRYCSEFRHRLCWFGVGYLSNTAYILDIMSPLSLLNIRLILLVHFLNVSNLNSGHILPITPLKSSPELKWLGTAVCFYVLCSVFLFLQHKLLTQDIHYNKFTWLDKGCEYKQPHTQFSVQM